MKREGSSRSVVSQFYLIENVETKIGCVTVCCNDLNIFEESFTEQ